MLSGEGLMTPMTVGIYGGWGTGKTSMMKMLRHELAPDPAKGPITLWFDAWKYARSEESLWRALLLEVAEALGDEKTGLPKRVGNRANAAKRKEKIAEKLESLRTSLYRSQSWTEKGPAQVNWRNTLPFAADLALRFVGLDKLGFKDIVGSLSGEDAEKAVALIEQDEIKRHREQVTSLEQFQATLKDLVKTEIVDRGLRLYIFIDDLDRCLPEDAIAALEAVKLFFDLEGCVFLLGMDRDVVERGIIVRYPPIEGDPRPDNRVDPRDYLDKIIQLPLSLPPLTRGQIGVFLDDLLDHPQVHPKLADCRDLIEAAAPSNPRAVKRLLNVLSLLLPLDEADTRQQARRLAKVVVLQVLYDEDYDRVVTSPELLKSMEELAIGKVTQVKGMKLDPRLEAAFRLEPDFGEMSDPALLMLVAQTQITARPS